MLNNFHYYLKSFHNFSQLKKIFLIFKNKLIKLKNVTIFFILFCLNSNQNVSFIKNKTLLLSLFSLSVQRNVTLR